MHIYTYFICRKDGSALSLEAHEFASDDAACALASVLLAQHASCSHVVVCEGEREIHTQRRSADASLAAHRPYPDALSVADALSAAGMDEARVAIIATEANGKIAYWNAGARKLYGWSADEVLGRDIFEITPALQSRAQAESIMTALQAGRPWEGEITLRRRDGLPFQAYVADTPLGPDGDVSSTIVGASARADQRGRVTRLNPGLIRDLRQHLGR
jgi:PAS domain S-box-containing protein